MATLTAVASVVLGGVLGVSGRSDLASAQPEPYWSVTEAAKRLFMGPDAVRSRIARGELVAVRTPVGHMILESELRQHDEVLRAWRSADVAGPAHRRRAAGSRAGRGRGD